VVKWTLGGGIVYVSGKSGVGANVSHSGGFAGYIVQGGIRMLGEVEGCRRGT